MIPGSANPLLLATAAPTGYNIERSLRFNSADSAYLNRTFGTPTTQGTFTISMWVKRTALGSTQQLFGVSTNHSFGFTSSDALNLTFGGVSAITTTAIFRDPGSWYHIVWRQSGTSHTIYVNNVSVGTATATSSVFNTAVAHQIGAANTANYFNGYLADIHFIDGQALDPSSFTEVSATTGQLIPKAYTGTFGTNGFWLKFSDNSAATATTLGKDYSGNSNNWTPNNLSVTAGAGNDSLIDVPVNGSQTDTGVGGEVRGNYCTWNPLSLLASSTTTNGNLDASTPTTNGGGVFGTIAFPDSGKWYFEVTAASGNSAMIGISAYLSTSSNAWAISPSVFYWNTGAKYVNGANGGAYGATYTTNDIIGVAVNCDSGSVTFYKNNTSQGAISCTPGGLYPCVCDGTSYYADSFVLNAGQRPFAYTAPSGFKALCTANLPAPTIVKPSTAMDVVTYTGTGSALTPTSSLGFSPDLVWIKSRSAATDNTLYDAVRGAQARLESNNTDAEVTSDNGLTAFNSAGFTLGTLAQVNTNAATYAAWTWDAGSSTVTNTQGSITSQVRANASAGFSIATYTGNGTAGATIGHGLGVAPQLIITKARSAAHGWAVYHQATGNTQFLSLESTAAASTNSTAWNNTSPSSTVVTFGTGTLMNADTTTYVAYCFAPVAGYSNGFSYTGNGSADGSFVYLGFRPRLILLKCSSTTGNWTLVDTAREGYNVDNDPLYPNLNSAEGTTDLLDITSNGFKLRTTDASVNSNAATYIGFAWAESPFNYSRAR